MPDVTTIATVLTSLKTATDIAKFLRESDLSVERAESKLKLAELIGALAETKIELAELQEVISGKDKRIAELEEAFEAKDLLIRYRDAMYCVDENGKATGVPYCLRCWENDRKQKQLVSVASAIRPTNICTTCGQQYNAHNAHEIYPPQP
jgi:hypothetical protein